MLTKIKQFSFFRLIYKIPAIISSYHFFLAFLGSAIYGFPSRKIFVIGVTGTKGKTTTLEVLNDMLQKSGARTALVSSLYFKLGDEKEKNTTDNTMPGRFFIQKFLKRASLKGCQYALLEVTSQGASLHRHRFINWSMAAILNLAPEHIEAHGSFEKYRDQKLKFLKYAAGRGATVFVNGKDASADFFIKELRGSRLVVFSNDEQDLKLPTNIDKNAYLLSSDFLRENLALAVSVARSLGVDEKIILETATTFSGVPGRMEFVERKPFGVVVDYAHTPDSLERVYQFLKKGLKGEKLICVLGSAGGGRDKWKRAVMGEVASRYCGEIILTNEDPYDESPEGIIDEIASGCSGRKAQVQKILDRGEAIRKAVGLAKRGDVVVITGKGSELYIHGARGRRVAWSDARAVLRALNKEAPENF